MPHLTGNAERQQTTLAESYEFPAPKSPQETEALLNIIRIDLADDDEHHEKLVPSDIATIALLTKIAEIKKYVESVKPTGEEDIAARCIEGAEAIAGLLAIAANIDDPAERAGLESLGGLMANWLERAELSQRFVRETVPIHHEWDESLATIMSQPTRCFSDPVQGPIPYTWILRRTVARIGMDHHVETLKAALGSGDPADLGRAFAGNLADDPNPDRLAVDKANYLFGYSAMLPDDAAPTKKHILEQALAIMSSNFIDINLDDPNLNHEQLVGLRIYGQALHDYATTLPENSQDEVLSLMERSVRYLDTSLIGLKAEQKQIDDATRQEDTLRENISSEMVAFHEKEFTKKRDDLASLYKQLSHLTLTLRERNYPQDIERRGNIIENANAEMKDIHNRLKAIKAGEPDPIIDDDNPDDIRPIEVKLITRIDALRQFIRTTAEGANGVRQALYDLEDKIAEVRQEIEKQGKIVRDELAIIVAGVSQKTDPLRKGLSANRVGEMYYGNSAYYNVKNALELSSQIDLANHFDIVYSGELNDLRRAAEARQHVGESAVRQSEEVFA